ncbi:oxidoreductase [Arabiibacter massiliensis]|uniref:oxidoreductase n=1 Tax=Arabiibacter massiliensis TaxID=1870985 RepID=UPI0009BC4AFD|nr:FAD-dependent oxidoreductase [Arabiibacter massiliensis]
MTASNAGLTRRGFLTGAAATAASGLLAGGMLTGCAPQEKAPVEQGGGSSAAPAADESIEIRQAPAKLNPQDEGFRDNTTDFATLFSPVKIGSLELSNRMVKSAAGSDTQNNEEEIVAYYRSFAQGGIDLVWMEDCADKYEHFPNARARSVDEIPFQRIADAIHEEGAYVGYQISCMGIAFSGTQKDGSGQFASAVAGDLTREEIDLVIADTVAAAKMLKERGFDAVEINAAGNNLGQSFFSRMRNHRDDEYGPQSFENRARLVCDMIEGIKKECGTDFVVQVLINGIEENDQTLGDSSLMTTVEENLEIAKMLEAAGADALHVRLGPLGMHVCQFASDLYFTGYGIDGTTAYGTQFDFSRHWEGKLISDHSGCGMMLDVAREFKEAVSIPIGTVTYMDPAHAPDYFEAALDEGKVDFLLMNRPLTVDPQYPVKLKEGRLDEIAPCTRCLHCHFDYGEDGKTYEHCRVNACTQRAFRDAMPEGFDLPPASGSKNVMVIGGGPAGMEAARIAALRGHAVTLYEKSGAVGGLLDFAHAVKGPHENLDDLRAYLARQLELTGVNVVTGKEVDAAFISEQKPDAVVVAVGGLRDTLGLTETAGTKVVALPDFLTADIGDKVAIVGSNAQAVDTALYLMAQGKHVTMITPDAMEAFDKGQSNWVKTFVKPALLARGMRVWPQAKIASVGDGEITFTGETGAEITIACDTVIEAMDMLPNASLADGLSGIEAHVVGDAAKPWNIAEAIAAGNLAGRAL